MNRSPETDSPQILIVDDEVPLRKLLRVGLTQAGYQCSVADSAEHALDWLQTHCPDVVVTDIRMPGMDGLALCREVRRHHDASVVVMTGFSEYSYESIVTQGASDFIEKPVRISEFVARIRRVLVERATLRERDRALTSLQVGMEKLQRTMVDVVQAMSLAVEMRDPYTAGHQQRVAELACAMAGRMELGADTVDGLRMACILHDLGKMKVPGEILTKPGELTALEFELIKTHVQAGYDILKGIEFPWPLARIVLEHHERVDGSGYPHGRSGSELLLESRILAVADVVETMVSHRPYRPARGADVALQEIVEHRGSAYDADVVDACQHLLAAGEFHFTQAGMRN